LMYHVLYADTAGRFRVCCRQPFQSFEADYSGSIPILSFTADEIR